MSQVKRSILQMRILICYPKGITMFERKSHILALGAAAILSLAAANGAAAQESQDPQELAQQLDVFASVVPPGHPVLLELDDAYRRALGVSLPPFTYVHTGPENVAPTTYNRVIDRGTDVD
jgi:hypothetical protein